MVIESNSLDLLIIPKLSDNSKVSFSNSYPTISLNDLNSNFQDKAQFVYGGLKAAQRALYFVEHNESQLDHFVKDGVQLAQVYKWLAVLVGLNSKYSTVQQRINYGFQFKVVFFIFYKN